MKPRANGHLRLDPHNARRHPDRNQKMIADSLTELGAGRSILVDAGDTIIAGNGVYEQAQKLGLKVKVIESDGRTLYAIKRKDLKGARARRMALLDNRSTETSEWDSDVLAQIAASERELLEGLFDDKELREIIGAGEPKPELVDPGELIDKAAELQKKWQVRRGDIWQIGKHRLMCGDSTSKEDVERLMGGKRAQMCFTSPPYNAGVSAKLRGNTSIDDNLYKDEYDDNQPQSSYLELLDQFTAIALETSDYLFVNLQLLSGNKKAFSEYWHSHTEQLADVAIWDKGHAAPQLARRVMDSRFEFVLMLSKKGTRQVGTRNFRGMVHNVYAGNPQRHNEFAFAHAATFPVDFPMHFIGTFTNDSEAILDLFVGTGSTLVACEWLWRFGYGMDISPLYCAVTLERLTNLGLTAKRVSDGSGKAR